MRCHLYVGVFGRVFGGSAAGGSPPGRAAQIHRPARGAGPVDRRHARSSPFQHCCCCRSCFCCCCCPYGCRYAWLRRLIPMVLCINLFSVTAADALQESYTDLWDHSLEPIELLAEPVEEVSSMGVDPSLSLGVPGDVCLVGELARGFLSLSLRPVASRSSFCGSDSGN